ncbi:MAG: helix-turn-helix transcriptional regulator [Turneriella sp.]
MIRPITSRKILGQVLREARKEKQWSQADLGKMTNIPQTNISALEVGRTDGRFDTIFRLASALDLEIVLQPKESRNEGNW